MEKAEQIIVAAIEEGKKQLIKFPDAYALGVLNAKYDMLRRDYLELKKQYDETTKNQNKS